MFGGEEMEKSDETGSSGQEEVGAKDEAGGGRVTRQVGGEEPDETAEDEVEGGPSTGKILKENAHFGSRFHVLHGGLQPWGGEEDGEESEYHEAGEQPHKKDERAFRAHWKLGLAAEG